MRTWALLLGCAVSTGCMLFGTSPTPNPYDGGVFVPTDTPPTYACDPGQSQDCSCEGVTAMGTQTCNAARTGWTACRCQTACERLTANGATPRVIITMESAIIGFQQINGEEWDSTNQTAQAITSGLSLILNTTGQPPAMVAARVIEFIGMQDFSHYDKPDSAGVADVFVRGAWGTRISFIGDEDSFTPSWRPYIGATDGIPSTAWRDLPLSPSLQFRVTLRDRDALSADDPKGTFIIGYPDICRALETAGVTQFRAAEMTSRQTLFFGFSVVAQ